MVLAGLGASTGLHGLLSRRVRATEVGFGFAGLARGEGATALLAADFGLDGEGTFGSLADDTWPGRDLGAVLLGDAVKVLGVTAFDLVFSGGLFCSIDAVSCVLTE